MKKDQFLGFGLIIILIIIVHVIVLGRGFVFLSADEFARTLDAASWAKSPYIFDDGFVWLPGHAFLLGLALKIHYDLFLTPRIVTWIFSMLSLWTVYLLARKLFNHEVALLSLLIVGLLPLHVYLSLTPLVDIIYFTAVLSFLYFFLLWLDTTADHHLLLAALMLGFATSLRYESWIVATVFSFYLGIRWLKELFKKRSVRALWLLSIGLVSVLPLVWVLRIYSLWGNPFYYIKFVALDMGSASTLSLPRLGYFELLLQNGALICLFSVVGILFSYRSIGQAIWFYLGFGLAPFLILTIFTKGSLVSAAYSPRYVGLYLVVLALFCSYGIYWATKAHKGSLAYRRGTLIMLFLYNLCLVYLRIQQHSWILVCLLAAAGIVISYELLDRKRWIYFSLSLIPLLGLIAITKNTIFSPVLLNLYLSSYVICLALFYVYQIWQGTEVTVPSQPLKASLLGIGMVGVICLYNFWGVLAGIPRETKSGIQAGLRVRQIFEDGALASTDKILIEVSGVDNLYMQVMSNHPWNFVLDRDRSRKKQESFLLDKDSSPLEVTTSYSRFKSQGNPLPPKGSFDSEDYLREKKIRLIVIKDPRLQALLRQQTDFKPIGQTGDYLFYYKERPFIGRAPTTLSG
jgi:hypothetical protein